MKKIKPILLAILGFFAARCDFLGGMYPFGIALLCVMKNTKELFYLYVGAMVGVLTVSFHLEELLLNALPYALLLPCIMLSRRSKNEKLYPAMLAAAIVFILPVPLLKIELYKKTVLVFTGLIAACLVPVIRRLYVSVMELDSRLSLEQADVLALCCVGGLIISSLPRWGVWGFDICIFALLITSSLAITAFGMRGCIWAAVTGIMWVIKGGDTTVALCLIAGGIFAGLLEKKRGGILLGFVLGDFLISLFMLNTPMVSTGILNLLFGCAYTVFIKKEHILKLKRLAGVYSGVNDLEMNYIDGLRGQQKAKLESAARMYMQLSRAFGTPVSNDKLKTQLIEDAMTVCDNCKKKEYCHKNRKSDTYLEFAEAAEEIAQSGRLNGLPLTLTARCVQPVNLICAFQAAYKKAQLYNEENPDSTLETARLFKSVADMLFSLAEDITALPEFDNALENQAADVISARVGTVRQISCRKRGESHVLTVTMKENGKNMGERICNALENGFVGKYRCLQGGSDGNTGYTGTFAPVPRFSVEAFALRNNKKGQAVCGDSFTYTYIDNGKFLAAISDGAGSGERAQKESESTLDLLEAFSDTHIQRSEMFKTMNRLLLLKGEREDYSTVDVTEFDLDNGIMYWTKIGAVPGYILRGGKVERVEAGALPMGIVTKINPVTTKKLVQAGDVIVLVSDGVFDGLCKGTADEIGKLLEGVTDEAPETVSERIMENALKTGVDDDMTVLVMRVKAA